MYGNAEEAQLLYVHLLKRRENTEDEYLEWLDVHDPTRAELLRTMYAMESAKTVQRVELGERLRQLIGTVDPEWWKMVRLTYIRHCGAAENQPPRVRFQFECDKAWELLPPTTDPSVRYCGDCEHRVYRCDTPAQVEEHARRGRCIAVEPSMAYEVTASRSRMITGRPDYDRLWAESLFPFER